MLLAPSIVLQGAFAQALPTGGQVIAGNGTINENANGLAINQQTQNMVINWNSFSIAADKTVEFIQPNSSAAALNRVMGNDPSVIRGLLKSNGKVFLVNPNGVIFSSTAQVNVGGLVASALEISTEDFMNGNYHFQGQSGSGISNDGTIHSDGLVAFVAAKIINTNSITANNVLLGAGSDVTLDLGGPVKLNVNKAAYDALVSNGGIIKADGGLIYISAKAAGDLSSTVINNSGTLEANTLSTGEAGKIYLLGDMENDKINVAGTINARATTAGTNGGFVETSASKVVIQDDLKVSTKAENGNSGTWLIDPNDYTIAASGGDISGATLATNLSNGNVVIATTGTGGNVNVNDAVSWSANKLTLTAHNNINVNANLIATGSGSLAFVYGQDTSDGGASTYNVANGAKIKLPSATAFTWQKGSAGATKNLIYNNNLLRFGNGTQAAVNSSGTLLQPFYYDDGTSSSRSAGFYKLTYSSYPLDLAIGTGGDGTNSWNNSGQILQANGGGLNPTSLSIDISGYREGIGEIISSVIVPISGTNMQVDNKYTLNANASFIKTDTTLKNIDGSATQSNVRLWVGTRDDYVGQNDSNFKTKGNIASLGADLVPIAQQNERANAVKISESNDGVTGAAVLFYTLSTTADMVTDRCCSFSNVINKDPRTSAMVTNQEDGSYALYSRFADLAPGQFDTMTWYYAAAPVTQNAFQAALPPVVVTPPPAPPVVVVTPPIPTPTPAPTPDPVIPEPTPVAPVVAATPPARGEVAPPLPQFNERPSLNTVTIVPPVSNPNLVIEGLEFVSLSTPAVGARGPASTSATYANLGPAATTTELSSAVESDSSIIANVKSVTKDSQNGLMQVFVYDGGINASGDSDNK